MARQPRNNLDWEDVGRKIYQARIIRGESQEKLARLADLGVSTIYHAERGRPIGMRSLLKICAAFDTSLEEILRPKQAPLSADTSHLVHRCAESIWTVGVDLRSKVPPDDYSRIQSEDERLRLGRLGLVAAFCTTTSFIMPFGPGLTFVELYRRFEGGVNVDIYRECTLRCERGELRLCIDGEIVELGVGDVVGYHPRDLQWAEPIAPIGPNDFPVLFTWTGAVRTGSPPPGHENAGVSRS